MKITIQDIEFSYNGIPALESINSRFEKGDFVALIGPNGSGKSTLIKCIDGILKIKKGAVLIDEKILHSYSPEELAKEIAYVPQNESRNTALRVFDIVLLGRKPYVNWKPAKKDLSITADILAMLHLEHIAMKDFNKLSGGQQQSVYIARALAQEPEILLLDEPTANLDIKHQVEVMEILKTLSGKGITIIIAMHDMNLAVRYATKMVMLKEGRIFACGGRENISEEMLEKLYDIKVKIFRDNENLFIVPNGI